MNPRGMFYGLSFHRYSLEYRTAQVQLLVDVRPATAVPLCAQTLTNFVSLLNEHWTNVLPYEAPVCCRSSSFDVVVVVV